jgi:hypothetical protein
MSIPVLFEKALGMVVLFNFEVEGVCPLESDMGGTYHGICTVSYLPETIFVDVARLQSKYKEGNRLVVENLAMAIYLDIESVVGNEIPIIVDLIIEPTKDHGRIRALINPTCFDWKELRNRA